MKLSTEKSERLDQLRALIAQHEPSTKVSAGAIPTGIPGLDDAIGGWPEPGLSEVTGRAGTGRLSLVLPTLRRLTRADRTVGLVDPLGILYPPGLAGVHLDRLLVVQPSCEQAGWTSEQLAGSGSFDVVVHLSALRLGRSGARLARAAERGGCAVIVVSERVEQSLPAALRLRLDGQDAQDVRVLVTRCRGGRVGRPLSVRVRDSL